MNPAPRTPRLEAGTKVVLPDGQVRLIARTEFALDHNGSPTGITLIFTDRWLPRGS